MSLALRSVPFALLATLVGTRAAAAPPTKSECIAASESGQDLRKTGKLRDAREKFMLCVADSCPGPVREDCAQHLDEVGKATPSIVFEVKDSAGSDVQGMKVTMDRKPVAASTGTAIELDPGEHTFVFEATGLGKVERTLVVVEGVKERRERVRIGTAMTPESATSTSVTARDDTPGRPNGPPLLAWAAFGVGGAGLVLGVAAGLVADGKHTTLQGECNNSTATCAPQYSGDLDAFHTWRTISTVGYVVGALGAAGGAVLWLTAPKVPGSTTAQVWLGPTSAGIAGRF